MESREIASCTVVFTVGTPDYQPEGHGAYSHRESAASIYGARYNADTPNSQLRRAALGEQCKQCTVLCVLTTGTGDQQEGWLQLGSAGTVSSIASQCMCMQGRLNLPIILASDPFIVHASQSNGSALRYVQPARTGKMQTGHISISVFSRSSLYCKLGSSCGGHSWLDAAETHSGNTQNC